MPVLAAAKKEQTKKIKFQIYKEPNSAQIHNHEIFVIFQYLQEKLEWFRDYKLLLRKQMGKILTAVQITKNLLFEIYDVANAAKEHFLKLTKYSELY